ncbi:MAG: hypothetical protein QOF48_3804 [Verrucomicrobiota bacterium]
MDSGPNQLNPAAWREPASSWAGEGSGTGELRSGFVQFITSVPRWLLLVSLVFAPWAYGATRPWSIQALSVLLSILTGIWILGCALRGRRPQVPRVAFLAVAALLLQGWWMTLNAHSFFNTMNETFAPRASWGGAPGSVDAGASLTRMFLFSGLLGGFLFCCDLFQDSVWRKRVWMTMALTGASIAAFGILQKIGGEPVLALIWEPGKRDLTNNFAAFRYRGNAGAYLNLALPLLAGLVFVNFQRRERPWARAAWLMTFFVVAAGIQLNPSRATGCIAIGLGMVLAGRILFHYWIRGRDDVQPRMVLTYAAILLGLLLAVGGISFLGGWETSLGRLHSLGANPATRSPTQIYLKMLPDAGVTGFGPGTFRAIFAGYQRDYDFGGREYPEFWKSGLWEHAHQDYLQTLIEWGFLGALGWAVLIFGGILVGAWNYRRLRSGVSLRWLLFCSLLALGATLVHALIDFPLQIASIQLYACVLLAVCWTARPSPVCAASTSVS